MNSVIHPIANLLTLILKQNLLPYVSKKLNLNGLVRLRETLFSNVNSDVFGNENPLSGEVVFDSSNPFVNQ